MKKIVLNLSDHTFQHLEALAVGLNRERNENRDNDDFRAGINKENDDFGPLVSRLLEEVADSLSTGVERSGSWERSTLDSLLGWQGCLVPAMFGELVSKEHLVNTERK